MASSGTGVAAEPSELTLVVGRVFDAPRRLVFRAWTRPEHLVRWWGPRGFTLPSCTVDLRPGGAFHCLMRSPEGTDHRLRCTYREIVEPERLVFTFAWEDDGGRLGPETLVTVTFADQGGKTMLTLRQAIFETVTARNEHDEGWSGSLDRLVEYLAET
jgi:uncharacterized protein YndB with AHSA1/START domain